jgi:hypothetical protein
MSSLLGAIHARFNSTPALFQLVPGLLWTGQAPAKYKRTPPYGILIELTETPVNCTAGRSAQQTFYQVSFFGEDPDQLKEIDRQWHLAFGQKMAPLVVAGQYQMIIIPHNSKLLDDPGHGPRGLPIHHQMIEFCAVMGNTQTT